ncbi:MAG TPA: hypothetical protein VGC47_15100 [Acidimicrobiia bacterium]|jgi:hypothetical protein
MSPYLAAGILLVLFVAIAAGFAWQERRGRTGEVVVYGVEESIDHIWERLDDPARARLGRAGVRRLLEWEVRYLQAAPAGSPASVVGGLDAAAYAQEQLHRRGHTYDGADVVAVLDLQADYLAAIGAIAEPATQDEIDALWKEEA